MSIYEKVPGKYLLRLRRSAPSLQKLENLTYILERNCSWSLKTLLIITSRISIQGHRNGPVWVHMVHVTFFHVHVRYQLPPRWCTMWCCQSKCDWDLPWLSVQGLCVMCCCVDRLCVSSRSSFISVVLSTIMSWAQVSSSWCHPSSVEIHGYGILIKV